MKNIWDKTTKCEVDESKQEGQVIFSFLLKVREECVKHVQPAWYAKEGITTCSCPLLNICTFKRNNLRIATGEQIKAFIEKVLEEK